MSETYHYSKGVLEVAVRNALGLEPWVWLGDVSELSFTLGEDKFSHKESYSGKNAEVREISLGITVEGSATMHTLSTENIARFTDGTATSQASGTVTDESLGSVAAGDVLVLDHFGPSSLVVTDSAGVPATIAAQHYEYDQFGDLTFNTLPTTPAPTMPLKVAYAHAAYKSAVLLNGQRSELALRYKGINLAEGGKPVLVEFYKVSPGLLQTLSLITSGNQLASAPVSFKPLLDALKPANGPLGQYGRIVTIGY